jgi:hypothetical protein
MAKLGSPVSGWWAHDALGRVRFNAIVVIESLPTMQVQTGTILHKYIESLAGDFERPVEAIHQQCFGAGEFRQALANLLTAVTAGLRPILHIEAHGSEMDGLYFADDTRMPWGEFCDLITPLNLQTDFGLLVVVSACYGFNALNGVHPRKSAPYLLLIGPSDEVNPAELMQRFRTMYRAMLETLNAIPTVIALLEGDLEKGHMMLLSAPYWFHLMISKYLDDEVTPSSIRASARRLYARAQAEGAPGDIRHYKRLFRAELAPIVRDWFESYFMFKQLPHNRVRYEKLWPAYEAKVKAALAR